MIVANGTLRGKNNKTGRISLRKKTRLKIRGRD